jgi:hypothetical protein
MTLSELAEAVTTHCHATVFADFMDAMLSATRLRTLDIFGTA